MTLDDVLNAENTLSGKIDRAVALIQQMKTDNATLAGEVANLSVQVAAFAAEQTKVDALGGLIQTEATKLDGVLPPA